MSLRILDRSRPKTSVLDFDPEEIRSSLREKLASKGVIEAYLFGSIARGECAPWSDLDIVDQAFLDRPREFADLFSLGLQIDLLVYSPEEIAVLREDASGFWKEFERQKVRIL